MRSLEVIPKVDADPHGLRILIERALRTRTRARVVIEATVRRIVQAGAALNQAKAGLDHGQFMRWLLSERVVGRSDTDISYQTAQRWMRLADYERLHPGELEKAGTITQAYRLAGLLPDPEPSGGGNNGNNGDGNYLVHVTRTTSAIEAQLKTRPLELWSRDDRALLKQRLQPLVDIYDKLQVA